jgi:hypothetical protein
VIAKRFHWIALFYSNCSCLARKYRHATNKNFSQDVAIRPYYGAIVLFELFTLRLQLWSCNEQKLPRNRQRLHCVDAEWPSRVPLGSDLG